MACDLTYGGLPVGYIQEDVHLIYSFEHTLHAYTSKADSG
jgi:hypothetical protein